MSARYCLLFALVVAWSASAEPPVTVSVNARQVIATNDQFWANAVFHPTEFLDTDWGKEHLALLRSGGVTLKFVRIYNQPEDASYLKDDGSIGYRWDHFDRRADIILSHGCRLLVSFYSMPPQIAADPNINKKRPFLDGKKLYIGPPKDYRQWEAMCADFTRHVIARYGEDRVAQWRFTCWNEPDLSGFWHKADLVEYRKIYDHFAAGVKSVCSRIPIGGPVLSSTQTFKHPEHFRDFLQHIVSTGTPIDYLAVHTYGGSGGGGSTYDKHPSVDYLMEQQRRLVKIRDEFPQLRSVPIVVQEWGVSSGGSRGMDKNPTAEVRNTQYAAAFLATMVARQLEWRLTDNPRVEDLFICLSGYEVARRSDFEGKRTVQTLNGFDKPLLNGYRALAKLGGELVSCRAEPAEKHLSAIAARDGQRRIAVIVTHFRNDRLDNIGLSKPVKIEMDTGWPDGTRVELRHWRIDEEHSNAYTIFRQLGRPSPPTPQQIAQIKERMSLEQQEKPRAVTIRGKLEVPFDLPCNAVSLLEVVRTSDTKKEKEEMARHTVTITSSKDGTPQKAIFYCPPEAKSKPVPLLVALHTWSGNYEQGIEHVKHGQQRKWAVIAPDFRGPNIRPEACASDLAVQDVLDAVEYAKKHARVDDKRIYVVGGSGGGHMSLMMAARAPQLWAGVSAWCPITDLAAWHAESQTRQPRYAAMLEKCCGGPPGPQTEAEYRKRSPLFHLAAAKGLPLDINAGIHDGHTGSVPVSHSLRAFNVLAGKDCEIGEEDIAFMLQERKVPPSLAAEREDDPERQKPVLFRRVAGAVRLTIFEGGHEIELTAALDWLSRQRRGTSPNHWVGKASTAPIRAQEVPK